MDLPKTILVVRAKVTKADGTDLDADERVGIVNNFLHSLFKQVDVFLKEKQVTQATGTYAYRAYLETLLNYGPAAKRSQLTAAMFYKDTAGKMDVTNPVLAAATANLGLKERYTFSHESGILEMAGPLFCDVFRSERLLLSFVDSGAFNGDYKKNPYNFQTFTTSFLGITVNGEEVPFKPLQLSYAPANP